MQFDEIGRITLPDEVVYRMGLDAQHNKLVVRADTERRAICMETARPDDIREFEEACPEPASASRRCAATLAPDEWMKTAGRRCRGSCGICSAGVCGRIWP